MAILKTYVPKFRRSGPNVDEAAISDCELELDVQFPDPYVRFLLEHNGGKPSPAYLAYPGSSMKIDEFLPVGPAGLVEQCQRLRADHGLASGFVPIAALEESSGYLVLDCTKESSGRLLSWFHLNEGFLLPDEECFNTSEMYFGISELFTKLGPVKNREDMDGMFCRLYYASSDPKHGPRLAREFVEAGYDMNFVLPTFKHPIFGALNSEEFEVVTVFLSLGTAATHRDPQHEDMSLEDGLTQAIKSWNLALNMADHYKNEASRKRARRKLSAIDEALTMLRSVSK